MTRQRKFAYLAMIITAILWGAALPIVKPALSYISPTKYLFYRYLVAAPLSLPPLIYLLYKHKPNTKDLFKIIILEFISITVSLTILYEALKLTTSLEATLIANTAPIFITVAGIIFLKEKEEKHEFIGLSLSIIAMLILALEPLISGNNHIRELSFAGNLLVIIYNFLWTFYVIKAKTWYKNISKALIGFISIYVGFFSFLLVTLLSQSLNSFIPSIIADFQQPSVLLASLYMGIFGSIIAAPLYIYGNNLIEASEASLFTYLQPLITIPLSVLWLKEPISGIIFFALFLTAIGVFIAERRKSKVLAD